MVEPIPTDPEGKAPLAALPKRFNPAMVKVFLIAFIFGLIQIPLYLILGTMQDRQTYNVQYAREYAGWGAGEQTIVGPVLTVPYHYQAVGEPKANTTRSDTGYLHLFPESLEVSGNLVPEIRDGGKFKNILYSTALEFKGKFDTSQISQRKIRDSDVMWRDAFLTLGVSDLRGIRKETTVLWNGVPYTFVPGTNGVTMFDSGQSVSLSALKPSQTYPFSLTLLLNGSRNLNIFPAGKESKVELSSNWKDPTFTGGFLPLHRSISKSGFNAEWEVSYFNRSTPQLWTDRDADLRNSLSQYMVGVTLATPVEFYETAIRAVKYGCLFIIFPFLLFFIFEVITRVRVHEMQYLLVGLSLSLFFLLLISISEYLPFLWAYVVAGGATIVQITAYTRAFSVARSAHLWKIMGSTLIGLYIYLYVLLQLADMSLLFGSIGLFLGLSFVLYATRRINWHTMQAESGTAT